MNPLRSTIKVIAAMSRLERIALAVLTLVLAGSLTMLVRMFRTENMQNVAVPGGTYIEGAVGEILPLNPWFIAGNDVNRDIVSLVFSGLMKYDPETQKVVDDLATVTISTDNRIYTATLKPNLYWHDSTEEKPHPVTADDVMYTFTTIQQQGFPNPILQQNFKGVEVEKIDERTVRFRLSKQYSFFTSNLTLGLVPASAFEGTPVNKLDQTLDFGFKPVGAGPYSFVSLLQTDLSSEITLKRFAREGMPEYKVDRMVFRVFPDYSTLLSDILNVHGVRQVPRNAEGEPILPRRFHPVPYSLPQYVGLFFNLGRDIPADRNVRLGLQLALNKQAIADTLHETKVVDTPLLEIDLGDWRYRFDAAAAKGAFFESSWNVPEKVRLQRLLEQREANALGPLASVPRVALLGTGAQLTLTGSIGDLTFPLTVNGFPVQTGSQLPERIRASLEGAWLVKLPAGNGGSGSLKMGMNIIKLMNGDDDIVDSAYVERYTDADAFNRAVQEQQLIEQFAKSKSLPANNPQKIGIDDLYLEKGFLRRKRPEDSPHTRINDKGRELVLTILTNKKPDSYPIVAEMVKKQWEAVGARVNIVVAATKQEFENKLMRRDYDVVLFGQSLFDNLDSYPYWHSSQIQDLSDPSKLRLDAFNLSQYASFEADDLLMRIRETSNANSRTQALQQLNTVWKSDMPAIVLYSPLSIYAHDDSIHGISIKNLSLHADRFAHLEDWYVTTERRFLPGKSWLSFIPWMFKLFTR
jgi:ABC-type transport system substrate-binding protein